MYYMIWISIDSAYIHVDVDTLTVLVMSIVSKVDETLSSEKLSKHKQF